MCMRCSEGRAGTQGEMPRLGRDAIHVVGASLGGMIAQRFVLAHPQRSRSLVLVCTTPGGAEAVRAGNDVLAAMCARRGVTAVGVDQRSSARRRVSVIAAAPEIPSATAAYTNPNTL